MIRKCLFCSKDFKAKNYQVNKGNGKYCSTECMKNYWKEVGRKTKPSTAVEKQCATCGKIFMVKKSHEKLRKNCSKSCMKNDYQGRMRGNENPNWRGGRSETKSGYIKVYQPEHLNSDHQGYVYEHRLVMEKKIGRLLKRHEVVHHIDGNKHNNDPLNLLLFNGHSEHRKHHVMKAQQ